MKRSRFSEEQIIGILKEHQAGAERGRALPEARRQRADMLRMALEVWRHGGVGCGAAEGARRGERQAEEAPGSVDARRLDAAGDAGKNF